MGFHKVLVISYHFPPSAASGSFRLLGFARHLPKFGWRCVVVAPPKTPWEPIDEALLSRVPAETILCPVPYPKNWAWKPARRFAPFGIWLPHALVRSRHAIREHRPDAIFTSGPPHIVHLLGRYLQRKYDLPWIADFRDPWVAGDRSTRVKGSGRWERWAERIVIRDADRLVMNTPGARNELALSFPDHASKMVSITNGYDPESFEFNSVTPMSRSFIEIAHLGEIYANRDPGPFLDAIRNIIRAGSIGGRSLRVDFIGRLGPSSHRLIDLIEANGLQNVVSLRGQVAYSESLRAMNHADILLLLDSPGRQTGAPAKLYEYLGTGRPVLALAEADGDVAWILRESGVPHRIASPVDSRAILTALLALIEESAGRSSDAGIRQPIATPFERERLAKQLATELDSSLEGRKHSRRIRSARTMPGPTAVK